MQTLGHDLRIVFERCFWLRFGVCPWPVVYSLDVLKMIIVSNRNVTLIVAYTISGLYFCTFLRHQTLSGHVISCVFVELVYVYLSQSVSFLDSFNIFGISSKFPIYMVVIYEFFIDRSSEITTIISDLS